MFLGEDAEYESDLFKVTYKDKELEVIPKTQKQVSRGCGLNYGEEVPNYYAPWDFKSDTWNGLLKQWATEAFDLSLFSR